MVPNKAVWSSFSETYVLLGPNHTSDEDSMKYESGYEKRVVLVSVGSAMMQ